MTPRTALLAVLALAPAAAAQTVPSPSEFTRIVKDLMEEYPADGTHTYHWPRGSSWGGNTMDLHYQGALFSAGDAKGRCYCCGLTFEVFFRAWERWAAKKKVEFRIGDMDGDALRSFRSRWFCSGDFRRGPLDALEWKGLGSAVTADQARAGDFVQLWRRSGSGHSVIFVAWATENGRRTGIRYWSTQGSTNGIGVHTESLSGDSGVDLEKTYFARVGAR